MGQMPKWSATVWRDGPWACRAGRRSLTSGTVGGLVSKGEDLVGDVAFEAANRFAFEFALGGLLRDVGLDAGVHRHPDQGDGVDRVVRSAVAAAVEPVPVGLAAGRRDRADSGERGEGWFAGDPVSRTIASTRIDSTGPSLDFGVGRSSSDRATGPR